MAAQARHSGRNEERPLQLKVEHYVRSRGCMRNTAAEISCLKNDLFVADISKIGVLSVYI